MRLWIRVATSRNATILTGITVAALVASFPLAALSHQTGGNAGQLPLVLPLLAVGFIVALRMPRNPIGWLFLADALISTTGADAGAYAVYAFREGHPGLFGARLAVALTQCWVALVLFLPLPVLLFPDGKIGSRFWRWTLFVYLADSALLLGGLAVKDVHAFTDHPVRVDSSGELVSLGSNSSNHGVLAVLGPILLLLYLVISLSWIVRQAFGYRHATYERKQQLKWVLTGTAVAVVGFSVGLIANNSHNVAVQVVASIGYLAVGAVPLSIGIGILKYRLYDMDRLISRTLSYAILTGVLVGVYIGIVTLATRALPLSSPIGVAASTLAAAALFNPLRKRVQHVVDRRFNRRRYNAESTVSAFSHRLRDVVELDAVRTELLDVVLRAVEPTHATVWIRPQLPG